MERLYSLKEIVKRLGIPLERLQDCMNQGFINTSGEETKAIFKRLDVYGIALFVYLIKERFISSEEAAKFAKLWIESTRGAVSKDAKSPIEGTHVFDHPNMLVFIYVSTDVGKELLCEAISVNGKKESKEGFHFFKALGGVLKNKLKGRSWDDFCLVNIGKIKRKVDAQLA
jgi:hypothetical protein